MKRNIGNLDRINRYALGGSLTISLLPSLRSVWWLDLSEGEQGQQTDN
jgi:hypothetical protein